VYSYPTTFIIAGFPLVVKLNFLLFSPGFSLSERLVPVTFMEFRSLSYAMTFIAFNVKVSSVVFSALKETLSPPLGVVSIARKTRSILSFDLDAALFPLSEQAARLQQSTKAIKMHTILFIMFALLSTQYTDASQTAYSSF